MNKLGRDGIAKKILISAFACAPHAGSEGGVGWRWACELAKVYDVVVVTDVTRRVAIEAELAAHSDLAANLEFIFFRPSWLAQVPLNSITAHVLYTVWQFSLLSFAKSLHRDKKFNFVIHLTYGVFRHPSFLGYLGIPFVFGPVGGGEDAPLVLKRSIRGREKLKELLRLLLNKTVLFDPFLWTAYFKATLILTKTEDTRRALPWPFRQRAIVYQEIGVDSPKEIQVRARQSTEPLRVLFAGRLLGWKGVHLAIRAIAQAVAQGVSVEFTLLGKGPFENELRKVAAAVNLQDSICWLSYLPQKDLFSLYQTMDCFLFPSLHDSSGNVVLEAQANGLPVVCLDLGGPATLVTTDTAIVVATRNQNEADVVTGLSNALVLLAKDEDKRMSMAHAAIHHTTTNMSWESRVRGVVELIEGARGKYGS